MINIKFFRSLYHAEEISNIGLIKSAHDPTDTFTKILNFSALKEILENNFSSFPIEQ